MDLLQRFIDAQDHMYRVAYSEMLNGKKKTHWIWFIFPQLFGVGKSTTSKYYGLTLNETQLYLSHPILSLRLRNILNVLLKHKGKNIVSIMGGELDAKKLNASMTLFDYYQPNDIFEQVIEAFFSGNKHQQTLNIINHGKKIQ